MLIKGLAKGADDELSDDDLEDVVGGFAITGAILGATAGGIDSAVRTRW